MADISKININGILYDIKDTVARQSLLNSGGWIICSDATDTPEGVTWSDGTTTITGTLTANAADHKKFYLVHTESQSGASTGDVFDEWVAVPESTGSTTYKWERLGSTQFNGQVTTTSAPAITALTTDTHHHTVTVPSVKIKGTVNDNHNHTVTPEKTQLYVDLSSKHSYESSGSGALSGSGTTTSSGEHSHSITLTSENGDVNTAIPFVKSISDQYHTHTIQNASVSFVVGTATSTSYPVVTTGTYPTSSVASQTISIGATNDNALVGITASTKYLEVGNIHNITGGSVSVPTGTNVRYSTKDVLDSITASVSAVKAVSASDVVTGVSGATEVLTDISGTYDKLSISGSSSSGATEIISKIDSTKLDKSSVVTNVTGTFLTSYSDNNKPAYTASVNESAETLLLSSITFASSSPTVASNNYGISGDVYTYSETKAYVSSSSASVNMTPTKKKFTTTKVNSASAPENITVGLSTTKTSVITSTTTNTGGILLGSFGTSSTASIDFASSLVDILTGITTSSNANPIIIGITSTASSFISGVNTNINIPEHSHTVELTGNDIKAFIASSNFTVNSASTGISYEAGRLGATIGSSGAHTHTIDSISIPTHSHNVEVPVPIIASSNSPAAGITHIEYLTGITLSSSGSGANVTIGSDDTGYAVGAAGDITTTDSGQLVTGVSTTQEFITSVSFS